VWNFLLPANEVFLSEYTEIDVGAGWGLDPDPTGRAHGPLSLQGPLRDRRGCRGKEGMTID